MIGTREHVWGSGLAITAAAVAMLACVVLYVDAQPAPGGLWSELVLGFLFFGSILLGLVAASTGISSVVIKREISVPAMLSIVLGLVPLSAVLVLLSGAPGE